MPEGWSWDRTLFAGSAAYYDRGRLPYAPGYAQRLVEVLGQHGEGRLLDVGCGPGAVTVELSSHFSEVVGLDPDADMLVHAARRAKRSGIANARWVALRAEELPADLGVFRAVLFAQSFHWTDREQVAGVVFRMLESGGYFIHISERSDRVSPVLPAHPSPPLDEIATLVKSYLGEMRRAGQGVLRFGTPTGERAIIEAAGFTGYHCLEVASAGDIERSADDIVAQVFSRSDSAPHLFGDRIGQFERDLRARLHAASPSGVFAERQPDTRIWIWQRP